MTEAEALLLRAEASSPGRTEALEYLGSLYFQQKRTEDAIRIYERLLERKRESLYLSLLSTLNMNAGRLDKSLQYLDQIEAMGPGKDTMEQVQRMRELVNSRRKEQEHK